MAVASAGDLVGALGVVGVDIVAWVDVGGEPMSNCHVPVDV